MSNDQSAQIALDTPRLGEESRPLAWSSLIALILILLATRIGYRLILPDDVISTDMIHWKRVSSALQQGYNPYVVTTHLNHPPFWMQSIYLLQKFCDATGIKLATSIYGLLMLAEAAIVVIVARTLHGKVSPRTVFRVCLWGIVLNPALLLQSAQHANFDVLVALCVVAALHFVRSHRSSGNSVYWLAGALCLGVGAWIKTIPLILAPLLLVDRQVGRPERGFGLLLLFLPVAIAMSVIYVISPTAVTENILQYRSTPGYFGITGLIKLFLGDNAMSAVAKGLTLVPVVAVISVAVLCRKAALSAPLFALTIGLVLLVLPTLGPGYASQYIYWWFCPILLCYPLFSSSSCRAFWVFVGLLGVMYVFEYWMFPSHGGVLFAFLPTDSGFRIWGDRMMQANWQTIASLPVFVAQCGLIAVLFRELRRNLAANSQIH